MSREFPFAVCTAVTFLAAVAIATAASAQTPGRGATSRAPLKPFLSLPQNFQGAFPELLSQTGAFADVRSLTPVAGMIAYDLNVPFWSDGADKRRWIAIPHRQRIDFSTEDDWTFPAGTVFVKHFELALDASRPQIKWRLETRLLVYGSNRGVYGATYKWRTDQSDAELVRQSLLEPVTIHSATRSDVQMWPFPGPQDCGKCHNAAAGGVLGVNTRQLNRVFTAAAGSADNQLLLWNRLGLFRPGVDEAAIAQMPKLPRHDDQTASLGDRARAYLHANCAYCHRPGGVVADFDARFQTPLAKQNLLDAPVRINLGIDRARGIARNDIWRSMVLRRVDTLEASKMPPLGHETIDRRAVDLLRAWIASLPGPPVVAPPSIRPTSGDFAAAVQVTLSHDDPHALVRYTLDGSAPTESSPVYRQPLVISASTTVRGRAFKPGYTKSITVQETFIVGP